MFALITTIQFIQWECFKLILINPTQLNSNRFMMEQNYSIRISERFCYAFLAILYTIYFDQHIMFAVVVVVFFIFFMFEPDT